MYDVEIDLSGLERDAIEADRVLVRGVAHGVALACSEGAAEAKTTHKFKNPSGVLERSIDGRTVTAGERFVEGVIEATDWKASIVEGGTKPHEIHAKASGGKLTFRGRDGRWVSVASVNHPGTAPDGFMGRAYLKAERVLEREVELAAERASAILSG